MALDARTGGFIQPNKMIAESVFICVHAPPSLLATARLAVV